VSPGKAGLSSGGSLPLSTWSFDKYAFCVYDVSLRSA
jgi:hypothetical protein